jgi:hypothetical protein
MNGSMAKSAEPPDFKRLRIVVVVTVNEALNFANGADGWLDDMLFAQGVVDPPVGFALLGVGGEIASVLLSGSALAVRQRSTFTIASLSLFKRL